MITGGFWYGRNFVYALNPFPQIRKIGPIHLPGPDQLPLYPRQPHKLSEYYNDPTVWEHKLFPVLHDRLGPLWPVILAVVVVALVWAFFKGGSALMRILAVTGMVAGIAYVFTPLTASGSLGDPSGFDANLRYVAPVLHRRLPAAAADPVVPARDAAVDPDRALHDPADPGHGHAGQLGVRASPAPPSRWRS